MDVLRERPTTYPKTSGRLYRRRQLAAHAGHHAPNPTDATPQGGDAKTGSTEHGGNSKHGWGRRSATAPCDGWWWKRLGTIRLAPAGLSRNGPAGGRPGWSGWQIRRNNDCVADSGGSSSTNGGRSQRRPWRESWPCGCPARAVHQFRQAATSRRPQDPSGAPVPRPHLLFHVSDHPPARSVTKRPVEMDEIGPARSWSAAYIAQSLRGVLVYDPRQIAKTGAPATRRQCQRFRSPATSTRVRHIDRGEE